MIKQIDKYKTSIAIQMSPKKHDQNNKSWMASAYDNKYNHMGDVATLSLSNFPEDPSNPWKREQIFNYLYESCCEEHPTADHIIIEQIQEAQEKGE